MVVTEENVDHSNIVPSSLIKVNDECPTHPPMSMTLKLCYGAGHMFNSLCSIVWFTYLLIYLQDTIKLSSSLAGIMLMLGQIVDAVCTPIIGIESDNWQGNCKALGGRRKSWYLVGTICVAISFPMIFTGCFGCGDNKLPYLTLLIMLVIIFQFGWAAVQVSHLALIPSMTTIVHERDSLSNIRCSLNDASELLAFGVAYVVFTLNSTGPADAQSIGPEDTLDFRKLAIIITIIGLLLSTIFFIKIKERSADDRHETHVPHSALISNQEGLIELQPVVKSWKYWLTNRNFYKVAAVYLFARLFDNLSLVFFPLYLQECQAAPEIMIVIIPMTMLICGVLITLFLAPINRRIGKKISFGVACISGMLGSSILTLHNQENFNGPGEFAMAILIGSGGSAMVAIALSLIPDLLGEDVSSAAFVYGILSATEKLANGFAVAIIQYVYQIHCETKCYWYYRSVMMYVLTAMAGLCLLSIIVLVPVNFGQPAKHNQDCSNKDQTKALEDDERSPLI